MHNTQRETEFTCRSAPGSPRPVLCGCVGWQWFCPRPPFRLRAVCVQRVYIVRLLGLLPSKKPLLFCTALHPVLRAEKKSGRRSHLLAGGGAGWPLAGPCQVLLARLRASQAKGGFLWRDSGGGARVRTEYQRGRSASQRPGWSGAEAVPEWSGSQTCQTLTAESAGAERAGRSSAPLLCLGTQCGGPDGSGATYRCAEWRGGRVRA